MSAIFESLAVCVCAVSAPDQKIIVCVCSVSAISKNCDVCVCDVSAIEIERSERVKVNGPKSERSLEREQSRVIRNEYGPD